MNRMNKILIITFFCIVIILLNCNGIIGNAEIVAPPDPVPLENLLHEKFGPNDRGTWYLGATPPDANESAPPLVFVQGLKGNAFEWWKETDYHGMNDMYKIAYEHGYRTAFVQLFDKSQGPLDQWKNGELLARMLEKISTHFGGEKVNVIAHSKGGVDTQVAATYYNAYRFVDKIITIASPHHGSYLSNLFHSWYGKWLAKILGTQGMGLSSMQTGNMAKFREEMDRHPNISKNTYYTISGTNWGPRRSILWCGGFYLSQYGANDGLINELSTHLSYAKHVFTGDLDHDLLRKGSAVWDKIEPVLKEGTELISLHEALLSPIPKVLASAEVNSQATRSENDQFVSGGELVGGQKKRIEVVLDSSEKTLFTIYCKSGDVHVSLRSPSGILYTKKSDQFTSCKGEDILSGMTVQSFQLSKPEVGNWEIHLVSKYKDAYLLTTSIIGKHTYSLDVPSIAKEEIPLQIQMGENADPNIQVGIKMIGPDNTQETKQLIIKKSSTKKFYGKVQVGNKRGVYNVVFVIKHKTKKGIAERTISRSIYVK